MTSANKFSFDVIATDSSSAAVTKIRENVASLTPILEAAAGALERMAAAQKKLGLRTVTSDSGQKSIENAQSAQAKADKAAEAGQKRVQAETQKTADLAARSAEKAIRDAERKAKASDSAEARKRKSIESSAALEERSNSKAENYHTKLIADLGRQQALSQSSHAQRMSGLEAELVKARQLAQVERDRYAITQRLAVKASVNNVVTGRSDPNTARTAAVAAQTLTEQQKRLADAERAVTVATAAHSAEVSRETRLMNDEARAAQLVEQKLLSVRYALFQTAAAYAAMAKIAQIAGKDTIGIAASFEKAFTEVSRTTGLGQAIAAGSKDAQAELGGLRNQFVELSKTIPVTFEDISKIGALGAQLGIASSDVGNFAETVAKFSATTNVTAESAATYFGRLQNILGVPTAQFENLGSAVSELGVNSVATEDEILAVSTQIGAVSKNAGLSTTYVLGLGTALASVKVAPELARGTTTRVFQLLSRATSEGGDKLNAFAKVMDLTSANTKKLFEENPDAFFSRFIDKLGAAADAGTNLTPILDSIGIKGARDVPVISRLAGAHELLATYVAQSTDSYAKGTYLQDSFAVATDNLVDKFSILVNNLRAFGDSVGSIFLPILKPAVDLISKMVQGITALPAPIKGMVGGLIAALGIFVAFRSVLALTAAGILAFRAVNGQLGKNGLGVKSVLDLLTQTIKQQGAASRVAAVSTAEHAATLGAVAAAGRGAAAGMGAAATTTAIAGTAAVGTTGAFRGLMSAMGGLGLVLAGVGLVVGLVAGFSASSKEAAASAAEVTAANKALQESFISTGGGSDTLRQAISADTKAYVEAGNAATTANGVYATLKQNIVGMADGSKQTVTEMTNLNGVVTQVGEGVPIAADSMKEFAAVTDTAAGVQAKYTGESDGATASINSQVTALGANTKAWEANALAKNLQQAFASDSTFRDQALALEKEGKYLSAITKGGVTGGEQGAREAAVVPMAKAQAELAAAKAKIEELTVSRRTAGRAGISSAVFDNGELQRQKDLVTVAEKRIDTINRLAGVSGLAKEAIASATADGQAFNVVMEALGGDTVLDEAIKDGDAAAQAIKDASDQYTAFVDNIFGTTDLTSALVESFDALGASIGNNGVDFSNLTNEGRANLSALSDVVDAFSATQAAAIKDGSLTAEQAAANTRDFIQQTYDELSNQGIDTSQLDFLNQYLTKINDTPWQATMNVDISAAIANLQTLINAAATTQFALNNASGKAVHSAVNDLTPGAGARPAALPTKQAKAFVPTSALNGALGAARQTAEQAKLDKGNKSAGKSAKDAGGAAKKASDQASEAAKKQAEYVKALASAYESLGSKLFGTVKAEGEAFASLQSLGKSLVENGKNFNTVTEDGRSNFDALTSVFNNFGSTLSSQIQAGTLSADAAAAKYRDFAKGVYGELVSLGVPTQQLTGFFKGLGVEASGWTGNSGDVQQYNGFITAAAEATAKLAGETKKAKEYIDALGNALEDAYNKLFQQDEAGDAVRSSMNKLRDAYQENIDKVKELRQANEGLSGDLSAAQADKRKAEIEQAISVKYGETDRAKDYGGQATAAGAKVTDISGQIATNNKEISTLEAGRNALEGFTDAAITNRASLRDLQKTMFDQITAYAATGKSTQEVAAFTEELRNQFVSTATSAGYTNQQIVAYTSAFTQYGAAIRSVPNAINTTATADTTQAMSALNAIPRSITSTTYATADGNFLNEVKGQLANIPQRGDYTVTAQVDQGSVGAARANIQAGLQGLKYTLTAHVVWDQTKYRNSADAAANGASRIEWYRTGGLIRKGFAEGGLLPGKAPDARKDNLMAKGPNGLYGIQSGEYVIKTKSVKQYGVDFMDAVNKGTYRGGYNGGGSTGGSSSSGGTTMVELSPTDRNLLQRVAAGMSVDLYADTSRIASTADRGNTKVARRGGG